MKIEIQDELVKKIGDAALDFFYDYDKSYNRYMELEEELKEWEKKFNYTKYREVYEDMNANLKRREKLVADLYHTIGELRKETEK